MRFQTKFILLIVLCISFSIPVFATTTEAKLQYNKGLDFYKVGQYDRSMQCFRNAIDLDADYIDAYYNLGSILEYLEQYDAALNVFKQIVVRKPTDYDAVLKAAELSKKTGHDDKAKMYLDLIPQGSYMNSKAKQLASTLKIDKTTASESQKQTQPKNNGVYNDIASPTGMATDNNGNLYVAGYSDNVIFKITPDGNRIIFLKDNRLNGPIGMVNDNNGNLYVANYNANNVLKIDSTGFVTILISDVEKPYGLHIANNTLFISSQGSNSIVRYVLK